MSENASPIMIIIILMINFMNLCKTIGVSLFFLFSLKADRNLVVQIVHEGTIISRAQNNVGGLFVTTTGTAIIPLEIGQKVSDSPLFCCMCN